MQIATIIGSLVMYFPEQPSRAFVLQLTYQNYEHNNRVIVIVLDSVGNGELPDAANLRRRRQPYAR